MSLIERLNTYGITIELPDMSSNHAEAEVCHIAIPQQLCQPLTDQPNTHVSIDEDVCVTTIHRDGTQWIFSLWDYAPGPGPDDFVSLFPTVDAAITAVVHYYLGGPTVLGSWLVPLHRHPELCLEQVRFALGNAVAVSHDSFMGIRERRHHKIFGNYGFGKTRWEWACQSHFLRIPHLTNPHLSVRLRRDAQEAYSVLEPNE